MDLYEISDLSSPNLAINTLIDVMNREIHENMVSIFSIRNEYNGVNFGVKEILESITDDKFHAGEFYQPFPISIKTAKYDKFEETLIRCGNKECKRIINLYRQFE